MKNFITLLLTISFLFTLKAQDQFFDCSGAIVLCEKTNLVVSQLKGAGNRNYEIGRTSCSDHLKETNSVWLKWETGLPGKIEFTIRPLMPGDDIDFVVYQMEGSILDCNNKREIRCMASGESIGAADKKSVPCLDATGLREASKDFTEKSGCGGSQDNFLSAIRAKRGDVFLMVVNNFSSENGFTLEFFGDAEFQSPSETLFQDGATSELSRHVFYSGSPGHKDMLHDAGNLNTGWVISDPSTKTHPVLVGCQGLFERPAPKTGQMDQEEIAVGEVYPNPAGNTASLYVKSGISSLARLEVSDIFGRVLAVRSVVIERGGQVLDIPVKEMQGGVYFIQLKIGNTGYARKMVKG